MINGHFFTLSSRDSILLKTLQFFCWVLAAGCLVLAFNSPQYRDAEGYVTGGVCFPIAASIALVVLGYGMSKQWRAAAFWLALALVGQAAAVQMVDAGQMIKYPHYRPFGTLLADSPWLLLLIAFQTVFVLAGLRERFTAIRTWFADNFKLWQLAGITFCFFITSATVSRDISFYLQEISMAGFIQLLNLITIVLAVWAIPESTLTSWRNRVERFTDLESKDEGKIDRFAIVAAIVAAVLAGLLSFFSYERHPHLGDEVAYLYQARYLATGVLSMPVPIPLEAFNLDLFDFDTTRWFSTPPVGWPLVLSLGVLLNADWLVNPVLAGICVLLAYLLVRDLYDRPTAGLTVFFLALSPWHALVGMSYMTHMSALAFALLAAVAVVWARKSGRIMWALLSGAATGMVGMIRPLEGAIIGFLIGLWIIGIGGKRLKLSGLAAWILGCGAIGAAIFYYNYLLTGSPTQFPIMVWADKYMGVNSNAMGFGPERGNGWPIDPYPGHSPLDAIINSNLNITAINTELFGWSTGSLILIFLFCFWLKFRKEDWLMGSLIAAVFITHFFYWFSGGPDFAARYWFLMIVPCVVLSVRGLQELILRLDQVEHSSLYSHTRVLAAVIFLSLMSLVGFTAWRATDKYRHYLGMRPDVLRLAKEYKFGKSLILIRGEQFPDFVSAAIYNPIDLQAQVPVYAWDENPNLRLKVLQAYADRPVWIVNGPSLTKEGFKVVEGPLPAEVLIKRK
ncbi:MAG: hypothetical protein ACT4O9_10325 [Blastocatellia bacterium]